MKKQIGGVLLASFLVLTIAYFLPTTIGEQVGESKNSKIESITIHRSEWKDSERIKVTLTDEADIYKFIEILESHEIRRSLQQRMVLSSALYRVSIITDDYKDSIDMKFDSNSIIISKIDNDQMYRLKVAMDTV